MVTYFYLLQENTQVNYSYTPSDKTSHVLKIETMTGTQRRMNVVWEREWNGRSWTMMSVTAARTSTTNALTLNIMSRYEILISLVVSLMHVPTLVKDSAVQDAYCAWCCSSCLWGGSYDIIRLMFRMATMHSPLFFAVLCIGEG